MIGITQTLETNISRCRKNVYIRRQQFHKDVQIRLQQRRS